MKRDKLLAILRLQKVPLVGAIIAKRLIASVQDDVVSIFESNPYRFQKITGVGFKILKELHNSKYLRLAEEELHCIETHTITCHYFLEENYPRWLRECEDAPILVFSKGTAALNYQRVVAVVGTRNATAYGKAFCKDLMKQLVPYQPLIVSGLAYGIDIEAHKEALNNGLETVAVLAHGLGNIYPKIHRKYKEKILQQGCFLSQYGYNESPQREYFLQRNSIIAGMSQATIVLESGIKGGALVTADIANSYHRDVMALPGRSSDVFSSGCNELIKHHKAHVLTSVSDLVTLLNWDASPTLPKEHHCQLTIEEELILNVMDKESPQHLDQIAKTSNLSIAKTATLLLQLELKKCVNSLPGKQFVIS